MGPDVQVSQVTAILPLCPFPPLHWWFLAQGHHGGKVSIALNETFVKQSFRNRLQLAQASGSLLVTFPVKQSKSEIDVPMDKAMLSSHIQPRTLWRSVETAYSAAPFFEHFAPELETLWQQHLPRNENDSKSLAAWSTVTLNWMATVCGWKLPNFSTDLLPFQSGLDLRDRRQLRGQGWTFQRYRQVYEDRQSFIGGLSGLDALFILGPQELNERLSQLVQQPLHVD